MRLPPVGYVGPTDVDEALDALARHGDRAAVLAGGQSLLLEMRYGDVAPEVLVGIGRVDGLHRITRAEGALGIGALVRHAAFEAAGRDADGGDADGGDALARLMAQVAPAVAHPPIRTQGTFVGSLAWGHPSSEWCALAVMLDAELEVRSRHGARRVPASSWFRGPRRTDRRPDELVVAAHLPLLPPGCGVGFVEHRRTHGSFAMVCALAAVALDASGTVTLARIGLAGAADVPLRAHGAELALVGSRPEPGLLADVAARAAADSDPVGEPHCSAEYRRHALGVVTARAVTAAVDDARRRQQRSHA